MENLKTHSENPKCKNPKTGMGSKFNEAMQTNGLIQKRYKAVTGTVNYNKQKN